MESNTVSDIFQSCTTDDESPFATPALKLSLQEATSPGDMFDTALNSGGASSDLSLKEGSVFSSASTSPSGSESESGYFLKKRATQVVNENIMDEKIEDGMNKHLLRKIAYYEKELESSQEKISGLEYDLAQNLAVTKVSKNLHDQFNDETRILELQNKISGFEASIEDYDNSNAVLKQELDRTEEMLRISEKEVMELEHKLKREVNEVTRQMQSQVESANEEIRALKAELASERNDEAKRNHELQSLCFRLQDATKQLDKVQLKLEQAESRARFLEETNAKMRASLVSQENGFQAEIALLKTENSQRSEQVDELNKRLDAVMFKYDMMAAEVDTLNAQAKCSDIKIQQMEAERSKLLAGLEDERRVAGELRFRGAELENVADSQRTMILERAEEKRQAIKQLCFALEYYRTEYLQLCRALGGRKR